jgi:predicted Rossmann fold flavoprotein
MEKSYGNSVSPQIKTVVVAGGGAAGLTAAWFAAEAGAKVILLERNDRAGNKIVMSGGSRCNLLPVFFSPDDYFTSGTLRSVANVFKTWPLDQCRDWFEREIGLELQKEEISNKWFPASQSGREVRDALVREVKRKGVEIRYDCSITGFQRIENSLEIVANQKVIIADALIMATGGFSVPTAGTDGSGHKILEANNIPAGPVYPALVPLTGTHPGGAALQGITLQVESRIEENGKTLAVANRAGFVFTHKGFSGPAVLDLAHWLIHPPENARKLVVNWASMTPDAWETALKPAKMLVSNRVAAFLPERLADALCAEAGLTGINLSECSREKRKKLVALLTAYVIPVRGHEGFKKAEVTGGGVPLSVIDLKKMALREIPGVYVCGEIVDVFGRIGGFNFYWAWVSGRLAGLSSADISA